MGKIKYQDKAKDFMEKYKDEHKCCPKCGETSCVTSCVCYMLVPGEEKEYKNGNTCKCNNCGDVHIMHDRRPKNE